MAWESIYTNDGLEAIDPAVVAHWRRRLDEAGYNDSTRLHNFAYNDLAVDLTKKRLLLAYNMGLGKTATAIAAADVSGASHTLFVVPNKLIGEWTAEFARLGLTDQNQIITSLADITGFECPKCGNEVNNFQKVIDSNGDLRNIKRTCQACGVEAKQIDRLARFNIISLRTLWTIPKDSPHHGKPKRPEVRSQYNRLLLKERVGLKHSFAHILRRRCEFVIVDEAYTIGNPSALQTKAVNLLKPRRRWLMTGTPVRGYPENILALLNWCLGTGTDLFPKYDSTQQNSRARFIADFGTKITKIREDGTQYEKLIPKINNPDRFQAMLAPVMRRRVNLEPEVANTIRMPEFVISPEQIPLDGALRDVYEWAVTDFINWFEQRRAEAEAAGKTMAPQTLMPKLNLLGRLAAVPQAVVPSYNHYSSKQQRIIEIVRGAIKRGRKAIVFSEYVESAHWYANAPEFAALKPVVITGAVSLQRSKRSGDSERERRLAEFRDGESQLLVATTPSMAEGFNIPQASVVVFDSFPWVPALQQQAWSRVLRPQQKERPVEIHLVSCEGTIDDYLSSLCAIKRAAIGEGIDYETVEIDDEDIPDPYIYANSLVESSRTAAATYGAIAWIDRLKEQANQANKANPQVVR